MKDHRLYDDYIEKHQQNQQSQQHQQQVNN
jgi:hypothetical protein